MRQVRVNRRLEQVIAGRIGYVRTAGIEHMLHDLPAGPRLIAKRDDDFGSLCNHRKIQIPKFPDVVQKRPMPGHNSAGCNGHAGFESAQGIYEMFEDLGETE